MSAASMPLNPCVHVPRILNRLSSLSPTPRAVSSEMLNMPIPQDIDPNAFEVLLRFLHCEQGTPLNLTLENVFNVHRVAEL